ncbi:MAG: hypothetical protein N2483_09555 [Burkholderiaceae bacterium]|nr:hypothetical protein [Burkholderiaceae bacterium]
MTPRPLPVIAVAAAMIILLSACSPRATGASEPDAGGDAKIDALATAYLLGDDGSEPAREAFECRRGREDLKNMIRTALQKYEEYAGQSSDSIRQAVNTALPQAPSAYVNARWEACPVQGAYGVSFSPGKPLNDGTVIWACEVSCSVHTPEAYAAYEEGIE